MCIFGGSSSSGVPKDGEGEQKLPSKVPTSPADEMKKRSGMMQETSGQTLLANSKSLNDDPLKLVQ